MAWPNGHLEADTPEARFERSSVGERERLIAEHHENRHYYGRCRQCGHRIEGRLKDLRAQPCPQCGFEG